MAQVRSFCIKHKDLGFDKTDYFRIDGIPFREKLAEMITECEKDVGLPHKTCQCFPVFGVSSGGGFACMVTHFNEGICEKVYVVLTF